MDERDWLILQTLYSEKSITKAAQALFISQPRLTIILQEIEDRFKSQIVIRGKKGVCFTPEGEYLVQCANEIMQKMHEIEGTIQTIRNEVKGSLKIGSSVLFVRHKLPNILIQFVKAHPNADFKVVTNLSKRITDMVYNNEIDIGFVRGEYDWQDCKDLLFEESMEIASKNKIRFEDLPSITRIDYAGDKSIKDQLHQWWVDNFSSPPVVGMEVDKVDSCKEMVLKGFGYAFLPEGVWDDGDEIFRIPMVDKRGVPLVRRTWMLYRKENLKIALVKAFVDFVNQMDFDA